VCFGQAVVQDGREWSPSDADGRRVETRVGSGDADADGRQINWSRDGGMESMHVDGRQLEVMRKAESAAGMLSVLG
jgi:hypothetical protein